MLEDLLPTKLRSSPSAWMIAMDIEYARKISIRKLGDYQSKYGGVIEFRHLLGYKVCSIWYRGKSLGKFVRNFHLYVRDDTLTPMKLIKLRRNVNTESATLPCKV